MDGFHWAFGFGAVFLLAALVVMLSMLRQKDVARIEAEAREHEPALAGAA